MMLKLIGILVLCSTASARPKSGGFVGNSNSNNELVTDGIPRKLHNLGRVGNKFYFADQATGTWATSKAFCENMGMKLGSIETEQERDFLMSKYQEGAFDGWYWTAARDSRTPGQFNWDSKETNVTVSMPLVYDWWSPILDPNIYLTYGVFAIKPSESGFGFVPCSNDSGFTLCESD